MILTGINCLCWQVNQPKRILWASDYKHHLGESIPWSYNVSLHWRQTSWSCSHSQKLSVAEVQKGCSLAVRFPLLVRFHLTGCFGLLFLICRIIQYNNLQFSCLCTSSHTWQHKVNLCKVLKHSTLEFLSERTIINSLGYSLCFAKMEF